jgi:hypothetical protein
MVRKSTAGNGPGRRAETIGANRLETILQIQIRHANFRPNVKKPAGFTVRAFFDLVAGAGFVISALQR